MKSVFRASLFLLVLSASGSGARSHPSSISYSDFTIGEREVLCELKLPLLELDLLLSLDQNLDGTTSLEEIQNRSPVILKYLRERVRVFSGDQPLPLQLVRLDKWQDRDGLWDLEAYLRFPGKESLEHLRISCDVLREVVEDHRNLARIRHGNEVQQFIFNFGNSYEERLASADAWATFRQFLRLGIVHIFTGYDHLMFLFGLLLAGGTLLNMVKIVTSFTVAHSLTLAVAALDVVRLPSRLVEAGIALSIAYVAVENLARKDLRGRWRITFFFGLIHGFGFANVLKEMNLPVRGLIASLFSFNFGVEIGQIAVVSLILPLLLWLRRTRFHSAVYNYSSVTILLCGLFWLYQRSF